MQHAFGESKKNIIAFLTVNNNKYDLEEINLRLPRKKIISLSINDIDNYQVPNTEDKN